MVEVEVFVVEQQNNHPTKPQPEDPNTVLENAIKTAEESKISIASESLESALVAEEEPGASVVVVAVAVVFVEGGVVVVEEKIEPDAASKEAGLNKT